MKYVRLRISSEFIRSIKLEHLFDYVEKIEILQAYQYDQKNFFSMQRITFKVGALSKLEHVMVHIFGCHPKDFQIIEGKDNVLTCMFSHVFLNRVGKQDSGLCLNKHLVPGLLFLLFMLIVIIS